jgi:hypothetical protein
MPAKEIKELRQAGKLEEALKMAKVELAEAEAPLFMTEALTGKSINVEADLTWPKRNLSWVYYDYLKLNNSPEHFDIFISWLNEIKMLVLPIEEKMLFEQICWQVGKMTFSLIKTNSQENLNGLRQFVTIQGSLNRSKQLFEAVIDFHFPKPSEGYSFLFKALHKSLKDTDRYIEFANWWDFKNFMPEDYNKEKMPNGKDVMSIVEQAYIAYAKHLLPKQTQHGEIIFNKEKAKAFLPVLSQIVEDYPQFQYPAYFNAKLLLALGSKDNMLESLLPFAKKKRNDFWVWKILAEAFTNDAEKVFACYCKALSCKSPEEMLVSVRQKMAGLMIGKKLYNEAKTEIELLVKTRIDHGFKIPVEVSIWQAMDWYKAAVHSKSNFGFFKTYVPIADALLFSDISEELVIVEFVNSDKKMLNFIASETKFGFFKYDRFFSDVKVGDILKVRFQGGSNEGMHQLYTARKVQDEAFKKHFTKEVSGIVKIPEGKSFGFVDSVYIHPNMVSKYKLIDGCSFKGQAIKSYNPAKKSMDWKLI